ncbi:MAG: hypothetical protein WCK84_14140, partial [Bacteroidota bacterium]
PDLLDEYESINEANDLTHYAQKIANPGSTLNIISDLIGDRDIPRAEMQYYHNRLEDLTVAKVGKEFFSFRYDLYEIVQSSSYNHMRVYAFVKRLISIDEYEYFSLADCFRIIVIEKSLIPFLREHLQWLYRQKILTNCHYKLDPNNFIEKYGLPKLHIPDPHARYKELDFTLFLRNTKRESFYGRLCESFESLYDLLKGRHQGTLMDLKIFEQCIKDFQIEKLEFFFTDVLMNIISRRKALKPDYFQIAERKNEFYLNGEEIPVIKCGPELFYDEASDSFESEVDDLDKLFPEIYYKLNHLYKFRDLLVERIELHYKNEKNEIKKIPPHPVKAPKLLKPQSIFNKRPQIMYLKDAFEISSNYIFIMNLLVDKKRCQPKTFVWKDKKKGYKGFLGALIKDLHLKGYFKENKELEYSEIKLVAHNTFGVLISMDTIKRAEVDPAFLNFIPYASTIVPHL